MTTDRVVDPVRFDPLAVTGAMADGIAGRAARLMAVQLLVEVAKVAHPNTPHGALLLELTTEAAADVADELLRRWPLLATAVDGELCVVAAVEFVNEWADSLLGAAMTAARIGGDDVAA